MDDANVSVNASGSAPFGQRVEFPEPVGTHWAVTYAGGEAELLPRRRPDVKISTLIHMPEIAARSTALLPVLAGVANLPPVQAGIRRAVQRLPSTIDGVAPPPLPDLLGVTLDEWLDVD